jgi:hypothetical protein
VIDHAEVLKGQAMNDVCRCELRRLPFYLLSCLATVTIGCAPEKSADPAPAPSSKPATAEHVDRRPKTDKPGQTLGRKMPDEQVRRIDAWWASFAARANDIDDYFAKSGEFDIPAWMHEHLDAIDVHLMWEFGPTIKKPGHRLVITPESRRDLRPLVKQILDRAPLLERWEFYPYRLAENFEQAEAAVKGRTGGSIANIVFVAKANDLNKIDLQFFSSEYSSDHDRQGLKDAFVATESLLGEEVLDKWIGAIEVTPLAKGIQGQTSIKKLKATVDELLAEVCRKLPDVPYFKSSKPFRWSLFELKPKTADDYRHQLDMFVGKTAVVPMWQNAHRGESFDSIRFSKNGETFCYIKLDGTRGWDAVTFKDKAEIEDAIDPALRNADVGCYVGGGTGLRYSYIDLALTDVDRGVEIVKRVLRAGNIAKRSWILFFDTDREAEWIGIWDDSPPPPMKDFSADD